MEKEVKRMIERVCDFVKLLLEGRGVAVKKAMWVKWMNPDEARCYPVSKKKRTPAEANLQLIPW